MTPNLSDSLFDTSDTCPQCRAMIEAKDIRRVSFGQCLCPSCGNTYGHEVNFSSASAVPIPREQESTTHKVYMRYESTDHGWIVSFVPPQGSQPLRTLKFLSFDKLEKLVERSGGLLCLADRQALEAGMRAGGGGVQLMLDGEQLACLTI